MDVDPSSVSKNVRAHLPVVGDAKTVMRQIIELLERSEATARPSRCAQDEQIQALQNGRAMVQKQRLAPWWKQIAVWKKFAPLTYKNSDDVIKPQLLCQELYRLTGGERDIATDVGQHQMWLAQYYGFNGPRQSITSGGLGRWVLVFPRPWVRNWPFRIVR